MHFKQISGIKFRPCHWILIGNMLSFIIFIWFEIMSSKKRSAKGTSEYLLFTVTAIWICSVLLALLSYIFHIFFVKMFGICLYLFIPFPRSVCTPTLSFHKYSNSIHQNSTIYIRYNVFSQSLYQHNLLVQWYSNIANTNLTRVKLIILVMNYRNCV